MSDTSLRAHLAGSAVMQRCLELQGERGAVATFFGRSPLNEHSQSWYRGALGEIEVARELAKLGAEWTVLHAVPVGRADKDIDHIAIGPAGVFTINTKNHSGAKVWLATRTFMVNGRKQPHIQRATSEAADAAVRLGVPVSPLIVVVRPRQITRKSAPAVEVINSVHLARNLRKRPQLLDKNAIESISSVAQQPAVWHSSPSLPELGVEVRFRRLEREVNAAYRRRVLWAALVAVSVPAAMIALAPLAVDVALGLLPN